MRPPAPDFDAARAELTKPRARHGSRLTRSLLREEYCEEARAAGKEPRSYAWFRNHLADGVGVSRSALKMRFDCPPKVGGGGLSHSGIQFTPDGGAQRKSAISIAITSPDADSRAGDERDANRRQARDRHGSELACCGNRPHFAVNGRSGSFCYRGSQPSAIPIRAAGPSSCSDLECRGRSGRCGAASPGR